MIRRIFIVICLWGLVACATAPMQDQDSGMGGTGAPATMMEPVI